MVYVGMDVHRKRTQVAVLDEGGNEVLNRRVPNRADELMPMLGRLEAGTPVAFEAGYGWSWLADMFDDLGLDAHLVHPLECKAIASARLKNDRVDARTIAHLLRADLLPEAWIAPHEVRDLRTLVRLRARLVRTTTAFKNRIRAVLADQGVAIEPKSLWTKVGRRWLVDLDLPAVARRVVDDCLGAIDALAPLEGGLERDLRERAGGDPRVEALKTVYGIGDLTAVTLVAEIGDIARFPSPRKLCAWAGLTPSVRNSADNVRHGHITKQGSPWVRWALIEAAQVAKTKPPYAAPYVAITARRGKKIAPWRSPASSWPAATGSSKRHRDGVGEGLPAG